MSRYLALDWDQHQLHLVVATTGRGGCASSAPWSGTRILTPAAAGRRSWASPARAPERRGHRPGAGAGLRRPRTGHSEGHSLPAGAGLGGGRLVRFQVSKEMADIGGDVVIDYAPVGEPGPSGERRAFALIVRQEIVAAYKALCRDAGLKLAGLTPRSFGTAACLQRVAGTTPATPAPESPDAVSAVLTVTDGWAEFCVVRAGMLLYALPHGREQPGRGGPAQPGRLRGPAPGRPVARRGEGPVRGRQRRGSRPARALQQLLAIPVHAMDPFSREGQTEVSLGSRAGFAGAVGLLHLWGQHGKLPINFVRTKEPVAAVDPHRNRKLLVAAAVAALFLLAAFWGNRLLAAKREYQEALTQGARSSTRRCACSPPMPSTSRPSRTGMTPTFPGWTSCTT